MPLITTILYNDFIKPRKRSILYIFLIAVFSIASYYAYVSIVKPKMRMHENFGADISNDNNRPDDAKIMGFFADWCPHCKNAKPAWAKVCAPMSDDKSKKLGRYKLSSETVDCSDGNDPRIQQYNINGYPTVIIVKDGDIVKYEGKITEDNLEKFIADTFSS